MRARSLTVLMLVVVLVAGCKSTNALDRERAAAMLRQTLFAGSAANQTLTYVSGDVSGQPLAINGFIYTKHWSTCVATEAGAFSSSARCRLADEARTYGAANGWSVDPATPSTCAGCQTWHVPVAKAVLAGVDTIEVTGDGHATAAIRYSLSPNEFGTLLEGWMSTHPAWCGPDPAAIGSWGQSRTAEVPFVRTARTWAPQLENVDQLLVADPGSHDKPC